MGIFTEDTWHNDEPQDTWDDSQDQSGFDDNKDEDNTDVNESADVFDEFDIDDESGFDGFGVDKISRPSKSGLATGVDAMTQFANATDGGLNCSVDLSYHDAFGEDTSGFEKDADLVVESDEDIPTDPSTVPSFEFEDDNFEPSLDNESLVNGVSPAELADDDDSFEESATGWNDLY